MMAPMTTRPAILAATVGLLLLLPCRAPAIERAARDTGRTMERAQKSLNDNELEDAVASYTEAIHDDPHNWKAFAGRAGAYARLQLPVLAEEDNDHAVEAAPDSYEPLLSRAVDRYFKKRYTDAIHDLDAAIHLSSDHAELYHWRGCAYAEAGEYQKAIADFTQVIEHDSEKSEYQGVELANRGVAEANLGHFEKALADYEQADKAGQSTVDQRGECLLELKRWKDAEELYDDILQSTDETGAENETKRYEALRERAVALTGQKLFDRAEADLAEAISMKPDNLLAYGTASWTRLFAGKISEARAAALKALGIDSNQLWIHLNLAHTYLLEGHFDWAKSIYQQDKDQRGAWGRNGAQIALQDIKDLREAGVEHPDMARAEAFLRSISTAPEVTPAPSPSSGPASE